jgi:hypothetical protein
MKYSSTLMLYFRLAAKLHFFTFNFLNFPLQGNFSFFGNRFIFLVLTFFFGKLSSSFSFLFQELLLGLGLYSLLLHLLSSSLLFFLLLICFLLLANL